MNPQPVSLADELRKLEQKWRNSPTGFVWTTKMRQECANELSALLSRHAVAETNLKEFLETESGKMMLLSLKTIGVEFFCDQAGPGWRLIPQHAAEQPKLTEAFLRETLKPILLWYKEHDISIHEALDDCVDTLLTSPVAPPLIEDGNDPVRRDEFGKWVKALESYPSAASDTRTLLVYKFAERIKERASYTFSGPVAPPPTSFGTSTITEYSSPVEPVLPMCGCDEGRCYGPLTGYHCRIGLPSSPVGDVELFDDASLISLNTADMSLEDRAREIAEFGRDTRRQTFEQCATKLEKVAAQCEAGGHTSRGKMFRAMATEFRAEPPVAPGEQPPKFLTCLSCGLPEPSCKCKRSPANENSAMGAPPAQERASDETQTISREGTVLSETPKGLEPFLPNNSNPISARFSQEELDRATKLWESTREETDYDKTILIVAAALATAVKLAREGARQLGQDDVLAELSEELSNDVKATLVRIGCRLAAQSSPQTKEDVK